MVELRFVVLKSKSSSLFSHLVRGGLNALIYVLPTKINTFKEYINW